MKYDIYNLSSVYRCTTPILFADDHVTRSAKHVHIPCILFDLSKTVVSYRVSVVGNLILWENTNTDVSEAVFQNPSNV